MSTYKHSEYLKLDIEFLLSKLKKEEEKVMIMTDLADKWRKRAGELEDMYTTLMETHSS